MFPPVAHRNKGVVPSSNERAEANEEAFRVANERIERKRAELGIDGVVPFVCECGDETCTQLIPLTPDEYGSVRASCARFVVAPGHAASETVVVQTDRYAVIEREDV